MYLTYLKIDIFCELHFDLLSFLFSGIFIECQGKTKVHWDKWMLRDNSRTYYECYRAEECYFKKEIVLYGAGMYFSIENQFS